METFFIIGGDRRLSQMETLLASSGFSARRFHGGSPRELADSIKDCRCLLGPVPFSIDQRRLFSDTEETAISLDLFLSCIRPGQILFGGCLPPKAFRACSEVGAAAVDLMDSEEVRLENAAVTAEGAVAEAIFLSPHRLFHSPCLVLGFGRCGQALAWRLKALGCRVCILEREPRLIDRAEALGFPCFRELNLQALSEPLFLFNTIPAPILTGEQIRMLKQDAVILDLASAPGGTDFEACRQAGIAGKLCPGLPGRTSPASSGRILFEELIRRLEALRPGKEDAQCL